MARPGRSAKAAPLNSIAGLYKQMFATLKRNTVTIALTLLILIVVLYNFLHDRDVIYCGTINDIESFSLKSIKTEFLIVSIIGDTTIRVPGTEHYQPIGMPVEVIESTSLLGNKSYKLLNASSNINWSQVKRVCPNTI